MVDINTKDFIQSSRTHHFRFRLLFGIKIYRHPVVVYSFSRCYRVINRKLLIACPPTAAAVQLSSRRHLIPVSYFGR